MATTDFLNMLSLLLNKTQSHRNHRPMTRRQCHAENALMRDWSQRYQSDPDHFGNERISRAEEQIREYISSPAGRHQVKTMTVHHIVWINRGFDWSDINSLTNDGYRTRRFRLHLVRRRAL